VDESLEVMQYLVKAKSRACEYRSGGGWAWRHGNTGRGGWVKGLSKDQQVTRTRTRQQNKNIRGEGVGVVAWACEYRWGGEAVDGMEIPAGGVKGL